MEKYFYLVVCLFMAGVSVYALRFELKAKRKQRESKEQLKEK